MRILLDTNLPLRLAQAGHRQHADAVGASDGLESLGRDLIVVPQTLYEFWVVASRPPAVNGLGWPPAVAAAEVAGLRARHTILSDPDDLLDRWLNLVSMHAVRGKPAHDARLVAAMEAHNITHILAFNAADFARYPGVVAIDPTAVAGGAAP